MPFTAAHPAIVLPFLRWRRVSASALVMGSITPDFEYFLRMTLKGIHGHTLAGLFYFNLPLGMMLLLVFHSVVKIPWIDNLPKAIQARLQPLRMFNFTSYLKQRYLTVIICLLIGSCSHLFWDSFTHYHGYFVHTFRSFYSQVYVPLGNVRYPLFYALQYISSGVGMTLIVYYLFRLPSQKVNREINMNYWLVLCAITLSIYLMRLAIIPDKVDLSNQVVSFIAAFLWSVIVCGWIFRPKKPTHG
jgi:hypothetical protein